MSLMTVITAQAALYSSELLTAWGVTGATTIAIAQAVALTLLLVAAIIAVVTVVAALYYCAQKVASAFKVISPAPVVDAVDADAPAAVAINTESLANLDEKLEAHDIEFKKSFSSKYSRCAHTINAGGLYKHGMIPVFKDDKEDSKIDLTTREEFSKNSASYLRRARFHLLVKSPCSSHLAVNNESGDDPNEEREEAENAQEHQRPTP